MRHQAVTVAPLSDLTAMMPYAEWLQEMPGMGRRKDRLCLPRQAAWAMAAFPAATLHWFSQSGHFPMRDQSQEVVRVILQATTVHQAEQTA